MSEEIRPLFQQAIALMRAGDRLGAEKLLRDDIQRLKSDSQEGSFEFAQTHFELGSLLEVFGRPDEAVELLRVACSVEFPGDHAATKERLTYMMRLGELLTSAGRVDEAADILQQGLTLREAFYGREHAGYAFGLEPLAASQLMLGNLDAAETMVEEAINNFWRNGHDRVNTAFALRAAVIAAKADGREPFEGLPERLDELDDSIVSGLFAACHEQSDFVPAHLSREVFFSLLPLLESRFDASSAPVLNTLTLLTHLVGPGEQKLEILERIVNGHRQNERVEPGVLATCALAMAESEIGDVEQAIASYRGAKDWAKEAGVVWLESKCHRELGLYLAEIDRDQEAEVELRTAVQVGASANHDENHAICQVALGIFLQHHDELEPAEELLRSALDVLDPTHPDGLCGRSHLQAIVENRSCGCGDMGGAVAEAYRQRLLELLPAGLVEDVEIFPGDDGLQVGIHAARELTDEESQEVQRIVAQVQAEFRQRNQ